MVVVPPSPTICRAQRLRNEALCSPTGLLSGQLVEISRCADVLCFCGINPRLEERWTVSAHEHLAASVDGPLLSIGLPVYNGERYLAEAMDALLGQTLTDFELIISDNASTDRTPEICHSYCDRDSRIRYYRQSENIGAAPNHNFVFEMSRGRYFKWASHDDLYSPTLLEKCVAALERDPEIVLAHSFDAFIDEDGEVITPLEYRLDTANASAPARLLSLLYTPGGNDYYGVVRRDVFRRVGPQGSYHNSDRTFVASLALQGRFYQVPEVLYFRRDHPNRGERATNRRARSAILDPRRADRWRNPMARLFIEYVAGYVAAIERAPMSRRDKLVCLRYVAGWVLDRSLPGGRSDEADIVDPAVLARMEVARSKGVSSGHRSRSETFLTNRSTSSVGPRVAAFGYFGIGNLGNECSLQALLDYLRRAHPDAELSCLAVDPGAVTQDFGIPARQMMSYRRDAVNSGPLDKARKVLSRLWDVPRMFAMVGEVDVVIVPGSGVLESQLGIPPWGLPYWLFLLTLAGRVRRRKVALVSIGAQYASNPTTRWFARRTVQMAHFTTFRDDKSLEAVRKMGGRPQPGNVYPDLAFSLGAPSPPGPARRDHVVIGVMAYYGGPDDPRDGWEVRREYTHRIVKLVERLIADGRSVRLVIGDRADRDVARDIEHCVQDGQLRAHQSQLSVSTADAFEDLLTELAEAEVVIASRYHNIVGAMKLGRPTVSLGYARKNSDLLAHFGMGEFSQDMDSFDLDVLVKQAVDVVEKRAGLEDQILGTLSRFADDLDEQFARISAEIICPSAARRLSNNSRSCHKGLG